MSEEIKPWIVKHFYKDNRHLEVIGKPLEFFMKEYLPDDDRDPTYYSLEGPFGVSCYEENESALEYSLIEEVFFLWDHYALCDDKELTEEAIKLKKSLLKSLKEIK